MFCHLACITAASSVTGSATVTVYESANKDSTAVLKNVFSTEILKNGNQAFNPLNILISDGTWLNAKTDDPTVSISITGYYIPKVD